MRRWTPEGRQLLVLFPSNTEPPLSPVCEKPCIYDDNNYQECQQANLVKLREEHGELVRSSVHLPGVLLDPFDVLAILFHTRDGVGELSKGRFLVLLDFLVAIPCTRERYHVQARDGEVSNDVLAQPSPVANYWEIGVYPSKVVH
eukprot:1181403-Prorocentrum_minimum.AAC.3